MRKLLWRFHLFILMTWFGYVPIRRHNFLQTWNWTADTVWLDYFEDEYSPMQTLREDWSYL